LTCCSDVNETRVLSRALHRYVRTKCMSSSWLSNNAQLTEVGGGDFLLAKQQVFSYIVLWNMQFSTKWGVLADVTVFFFTIADVTISLEKG
jgi:hypothetical protein